MGFRKRLIIIICIQKKDLIFMGFFLKTRGGGLTSVVQNYFDKGVQTSIMSSPNADMIAVSLACPKDPKSPYSMGPPS